MFMHRLSLIIITSHTLARVDLRGRRRLQIAGLWQRPMLEAASPAALVATAIKLAPHRPKRVWVLNSELATASIALPLEISVLLADGELEHALALEAEGQTGITATNSHIGSITIPMVATELSSDADRDNEHYWLTQIADTEIDAMRSAARGLGAQLVAVAHPHCAACQAGVSPSSVPSETNSIDDLAEQWSHVLSPRVGWNCAPLPGAIYVDADCSMQNQVALQLTACLLTACCLGGWASHRHASIARLTADIAAYEKKNSERENAANLIKLVEFRNARLTEEIAKAAQHQQELRRKIELAEQTARHFQSYWSDLLDALRAAASDDCWIQSWRTEQEQIVLQGVAIDQVSIHRFVGCLDEQLRDSCWMVLPANTSQTELDLVSFSIAIQMQARRSPSSGITTAAAAVSTNMEHCQR